MNAGIQIDRERIAEFCKKHRIRKLSLFGSILRGDFRSDSDVDVLVEFEPEQEPGFLRLARMARELSDMFGRPVDLRTPEDLSRLFREDVINSAEVLHAA